MKSMRKAAVPQSKDHLSADSKEMGSVLGRPGTEIS